MALIFPRIAQNFIKNGYFPTDLPTLDRIASALDAPGPTVRVLDPCCGEGAALAHLVEHLQSCGTAVRSFGVDVDEERAWHAKEILQTVAHADVHDVRISERSMGLLFLNPPYGDLVADEASGDRANGRQRHEKVFCRRTFTLLQPGGVLVLVVPFSTLDLELSTFIARHFERVQVFISCETTFRQCVLFGVKRRPASPSSEVVRHLVEFSHGDHHAELPEQWIGQPYEVPACAAEEFHFTVVRLDARQLQAELDGGLTKSTLWPRFGQLMTRGNQQARRPLRAMTDWHLALALAAGQITGIVHSADGRRLLIKGRTFKKKETQVLLETLDDGSIAETRVLTDKFVTVIRGVDLSPGPTLGQVVTIA